MGYDVSVLPFASSSLSPMVEANDSGRQGTDERLFEVLEMWGKIPVEIEKDLSSFQSTSSTDGSNAAL